MPLPQQKGRDRWLPACHALAAPLLNASIPRSTRGLGGSGPILHTRKRRPGVVCPTSQARGGRPVPDRRFPCSKSVLGSQGAVTSPHLQGLSPRQRMITVPPLQFPATLHTDILKLSFSQFYMLDVQVQVSGRGSICRGSQTASCCVLTGDRREGAPWVLHKER